MPDVVVIGGGIIGLLCSRLLRLLGLSTVLVDRQAVGKEASWAGGGILSTLYPARYPVEITALVRGSMVEYPATADAMKAETGIDPEFVKSGLIVLDPEPNEAETAANLQKLWGGEYRFLGPRELASLENCAVSADTGSALYLPDVAQIRNPRLTTALRQAILQRGGEILETNHVTELDCSDGKFRGIRATKGYIAAGRCIVTAGAWTSLLLEATGVHLPIAPVRGQMLLIKGPTGYLRHIIVRDSRYLVPRNDGRILVGSTVERVGFDKSTTEDARRMLHEAALNIIPGLAAYPIEHHWAGLRPGTPDGIPYIGEHPAIRGLYVCAGHHRNGFATGPASAQLVVDLLLGRKPAIDPTPYRLDRPIVPWSA